jgi:hypothetical protein
MIQLIYAIHHDGIRHLLFAQPASFDVRKWAESRRDAFRLLGIVKLEVEKMKV